MARPKKTEDEKRIHEHKVNLNDFEEQKLIEIAEGRNFAYVIRDMLSRTDCSQTIPPQDRESARQIRKVNELVNQLYCLRQTELEVQAQREKQSGLNRFPLTRINKERSHEAEDNLWSELNELLRELNAQLLGYADDHNR